ncbi:MAG TPA: hypothetical protein VJV74_11485 [Terriglobia bacterium]|nr:hypothetical protein [Terriglobia bacterium]
MKGGVTYEDMEIRKIKARNLDEALEYLQGRLDSEKLMRVEAILRRDLPTERSTEGAR